MWQAARRDAASELQAVLDAHQANILAGARCREVDRQVVRETIAYLESALETQVCVRARRGMVPCAWCGRSAG